MLKNSIFSLSSLLTLKKKLVYLLSAYFQPCLIFAGVNMKLPSVFLVSKVVNTLQV
jgi:hypothetical protein